MRYAVEGSGPALVLLPGLGCDARMWSEVGDALGQRYTLVHPHISGAGSLEAAARGVGSILDEMKLRRAGVAGLSMGGYVAFECLRLWPERIPAVALLDTTAFGDTPERRSGRRETLGMLQAGNFEQVLETFVCSVLSSARGPADPVAAQLCTMARDLGQAAFAADVRAILERESYEDVLPLIRVPTLFLCGEQDALTPGSVARAMARQVPSAQVVEILGAGHMTPMENPSEVALALGSFFDQHLSRHR